MSALSRWIHTGVGAGMASFLSAALGDKVIPFEFNTRTKSDLLWDFLGIIDSGRFKDYQPPDDQHSGSRSISANLRSSKDRRSGSAGASPMAPATPPPVTWSMMTCLISAAMCAVLDKKEWFISMPTFIIEMDDPLDELDRGF